MLNSLLETDQEAIGIMKYGIWIRISIVITVLIILLTLSATGRYQIPYVLYIITLCASWASIYEIGAIKYKALSKNFLWVSITSDILFITVGAHFTSNETFIAIVYMVAIATSGLANMQAGIYTAFLASIFYPMLLIIEFFEIVPTRFIFSNGLLAQITSILPGLIFNFLIAILVGYLTDSLKKQKRKIELLSNKVKKLYQKTKISSESIFENIEDGFLVISMNGIIEKANIAAGHMLNNSNLDKMSIEQLSKMVNPEILEVFRQAKTTPTTNEIIIQKPNHKVLEISSQKLSLEKNTTDVVVMIINDITPAWGEVYDSSNNAPLQGAIVRIYNQTSSRLMETDVTDDTGRFNFLAKPGSYYIKVAKHGYNFPSLTENQDYKGGVIIITNTSNESANVKIPLDPKK